MRRSKRWLKPRHFAAMFAASVVLHLIVALWWLQGPGLSLKKGESYMLSVTLGTGHEEAWEHAAANERAEAAMQEEQPQLEQSEQEEVPVTETQVATQAVMSQPSQPRRKKSYRTPMLAYSDAQSQRSSTIQSSYGQGTLPAQEAFRQPGVGGGGSSTGMRDGWCDPEFIAIRLLRRWMQQNFPPALFKKMLRKNTLLTVQINAREGEVQEVRLVKSSGDPEIDAAVRSIPPFVLNRECIDTYSARVTIWFGPLDR